MFSFYLFQLPHRLPVADKEIFLRYFSHFSPSYLDLIRNGAASVTRIILAQRSIAPPPVLLSPAISLLFGAVLRSIKK
jgi:hypothetical protein